MAFLQRLLKWMFISSSLFLLTACETQEAQDKVFFSPEILISRGQPESKLGEYFNDALVAELQNKLSQPQLAVEGYQSLSLKLNDPEIAKRATVIAAKNGQIIKGLETAKHWVKLNPKNLEAQQYLSLLLLRNDFFNASANQLDIIRGILEENYKKDSAGFYAPGLKFIGSMLTMESRNKKALKVFTIYLDKYGSHPRQAQENLIHASLAMKAKEYEVVVTSLANIRNKDSAAYISTVLMEVSALKKLGRLKDAVKILTQFIDKKVANDSTKLELVRLLILDKQNSKAENHLKTLVQKHPNNNDLLKSLIALEIDQEKWSEAKKNIARLRESASYRSDADYFSGEVLEAKGDVQSALKSYMNVKNGTLLKRAKKKIAKINKQMNSQKVNYKKTFY